MTAIPILLLLTALAPIAEATFADVATTAGVATPAGPGCPGPSMYCVMGHGAAWADYDGDGDPDLYIAGNQTSVLYRNNGDSTFTDVTAAAGVANPGGQGNGAAWADYDNDGDPDLYVTNWVDTPGVEAGNRLYRNSGNGTFTDVSAAAGVGVSVGGTSVCWGDYNLDGWADLYVEDYPREPALWSQGADNRPNYLFRNDGNGTFTDVTTASGALGEGYGFACVWFDYDNDGWPDLYTVNDRPHLGGWSLLYRNNRNGTFTNVTDVAEVRNLAGDAMGVDVGDYDNDGDFDIYVANVAPNVLYRNNGDQTFTEVGAAAGVACTTGFICISWGVGFFDYDRDGWPDLFVANGEMGGTSPQPDVLFHNDGDGTFTEVGAAQGVNDTAHGRGAAFADFDGDHDLDVYVANNDGPGRLWRNDNNPGAHWIAFRLTGTDSTREALGAVVEVTSGWGTQRQVVKSGASYAGDSTRELLFGLDTATVPVDAVVRWPNGVVETLTGLSVDATYELTEPRPPAPLADSPADSASVMAGDVTFTWDPASGNASAAKTEILIARDPLLTDLVLPPTEAASGVTFTLTQAGTYYWSLRGNTTVGKVGDWATARSLEVLPVAPQIGAIVASSPVLTRGQSARLNVTATDDVTAAANLDVSVLYEVDSAWVSEGVAVAYTSPNWTATFTAPLALDAGTYRFRVIAEDEDGALSAPAYLNITVYNNLPAPPQVNGSLEFEVSTPTIRLDLGSDTEPGVLETWVQIEQGAQVVVGPTRVNGTSWTVPVELEPGLYRLVLWTRDAEGANSTAWTATLDIEETGTPAAPLDARSLILLGIIVVLVIVILAAVSRTAARKREAEPAHGKEPETKAPAKPEAKPKAKTEGKVSSGPTKEKGDE